MAMEEPGPGRQAPGRTLSPPTRTRGRGSPVLPCQTRRPHLLWQERILPCLLHSSRLSLGDHLRSICCVPLATAEPASVLPLRLSLPFGLLPAYVGGRTVSSLGVLFKRPARMSQSEFSNQLSPTVQFGGAGVEVEACRRLKVLHLRPPVKLWHAQWARASS